MDDATLRLDARADEARAIALDFQTIVNTASGVGTFRDKLAYTSINANVHLLGRNELKSLPRKNSILKKIIQSYPKYGANNWYQLKMGEGTKIDPNLIVTNYLADLQGDNKESYQSMFLKCSINARQYGDAFIILGIADGRKLDQPINLEGIRSIRWMIPVTRYQLFPVLEKYVDYQNPEHYALSLSNMGLQLPEQENKKTTQVLIHKDRILRFSGDRLYDDSLIETGGYNDPVLQAILESYLQWGISVSAAATQIQDADQYFLGVKGLRELFQTAKEKNEDISIFSKIHERASKVDLARSALRAVLHDLEDEKPSVLSREFSGVDPMLDRLESYVSAAADMPRFKLFSQVGSTGIGNGIQSATILRFEWAIMGNMWCEENWRINLERLCKYAMLAQDSPTSGSLPDDWSVQFPLNVELTPDEKSKIQQVIAQRDDLNIKNLIYNNIEARTQYAGSKFQEINLLPQTKMPDATDAIAEAKQPKQPTLGGNNNSSSKNKNEKENLKTDDATPAKKILTWQDFKIGVQHLPFQTRPGHKKMLVSGYGYFQKTKSPHDGMCLDCYIGSDLNSPHAFAIAQHINGEFDEEKIVIGTHTIEEALRLYLAAMPEEMLGGIRRIQLSELNSYRV